MHMRDDVKHKMIDIQDQKHALNFLAVRFCGGSQPERNSHMNEIERG